MTEVTNEQKTLEDLAMSLVEEQYDDLYREKILPLYKGVKEIIVKEGCLSEEDEVGYGTDFNEELNIDSLGAVGVVQGLEDEFNVSISNEDAEKMTNIYNVIFYLLSHEEQSEVEPEEGKIARVISWLQSLRASKAADRTETPTSQYPTSAIGLMHVSFQKASSLYEQVAMVFVNALGEEAKEFGLHTSLQTIEETKRYTLRSMLNDRLVHDFNQTEQLLNKTPFAIVEYLARRDIKL